MSKFGKNNKKSAENPEIYLSGRRKTTNSQSSRKGSIDEHSFFQINRRVDLAEKRK